MLSQQGQRIAAKFASTSEDQIAGSFHPLACHMLDVAAVTRALWDQVLSPGTKALISGGLALEPADAARWVEFIAAAHDLGKAGAAFQSMNRGAAERLPGLGIVAPKDRNRDTPRHGMATAAFLPAFLEEQGVAEQVANRLAAVTGGHHGRFPQLGHAQAIVEDPASIGESTTALQWSELRREHLDMLFKVLELPAIAPTRLTNRAAIIIAGLITVADWIASMATTPRGEPWHFPFSPEGAADPMAYFGRAVRVAEAALAGLRWTPGQRAGFATSYQALFGADFEPRPLQRIAAEVAETADNPGLVIIEAPMGEGKTEAAIYLLDKWGSAGARGAYVAMPTMATSNQMYGRFHRYLEARYSGSGAVLERAHGMAALAGDPTEIIRALEDELADLPIPNINEEGHGQGPGVTAAEWFHQRKRALLAQFGVGTIDQALLGVLQTKHNFVRLFGLAGKAILIDEVHAYDTYMASLLDRLLEWLAATGSPVILLSATLPTTRRRDLVAAYQRGLSADGEGTKPAESSARASYPRITWIEGGAVRERHIEQSSSGRVLRIEAIPDSLEAIAKLLVEQLEDGGCAAVVCNTVARAQETFRALRDLLPEWHDQIDLFHARFLYEDRARIESEVLERFGPGRHTEVRPRRILVATQVIEQSLDLDFDLMITDPAPLDLLLQRSGRMRRHERPRPARFSEASPTLYICWDPEPRNGPAFDSGTKYVYAEHILLRTWSALRGRDTIAVPADLESLIDQVYEEQEQAAPTEEVGARWRDTRGVWRRFVRKLRILANQPLMPEPTFHEGEFLDFVNSEDLLVDRPDAALSRQAPTRFDELPSLECICLAEGDPLVEQAGRGPGHDGVISLISRSVTLRGHWVTALARPTGNQPIRWQSSPHLRSKRLIIFRDGRFQVEGGPTLGLDTELGITIAFATQEEDTDWHLQSNR